MEMHRVRSAKSISLMTKRLGAAPLQLLFCYLRLPTEVVRIPKKKRTKHKTVVQATATSQTFDKENLKQLASRTAQ